MPHPHSPHRPASGDVSGGLGATPTFKDSIYTPGPLRSQLSLSSASRRPSGAQLPHNMATSFSESASSQEQQHPPPSLTGLDGTAALQWAHYDAPVSQLAQNGFGYSLPTEYASDSTALVDYTPTPNGLPFSTNDNLAYPAFGLDPSCPRSYANGLALASPMGAANIIESYPPSAYVIEAPRTPEEADAPDHSISNRLLQLDSDYNSYYGASVKVEEHYDSPYGSVVGACSSTSHDDPPVATPRELKNDGIDDVGIDKEQPYAQLIYRALMEADNHTMILKDIYNWFKDNTDKAADKETKGWQNSIRHNLSMNGAFEKVDQPGEDARKGFMWKLTDEAVREGVKSTTRYRSKAPNKRGPRSQHPLPQRQASGAKGGQAARRAAKMRRSQRASEKYAHCSDRYVCRSVPTVYDQTSYEPCFDMPMPYPSSPFYVSEVDFGQPSSQDDFGSPLMGSGLDLRSYSTSPMSQGSFYDPAQVFPQDPSEPMFYRDETASPSASEPRTPDSPGDCYMDMGMDIQGTYIFDDITSNYRE